MTDSEYMRRALDLARRGIGLTSPNPPVGALVVQGDRVLGRGWHQRAGLPHAEVEAIAEATRMHGAESLRGATLYVTLEPCSTTGRTGPCTTAIAEAGIRQVVIGAADPNPNHAGRAAGILGSAGIVVREGIEESACQEVIRAFGKVQKCGLPWLIVKTAMTLDGKITRPAGEGSWISSEASRTDVQRLRAEADAILTSGRTVRRDNPHLTLRNLDSRNSQKQPWRVILTSRDQGVPSSARVLTDDHRERTLVFRRQRIETVLRSLVSDHEICTVLVEAGGELVGRLVDEGWVDEVVVYLAPLLGGGSTPAVGGEGAGELAGRLPLAAVRFERIGSDVRLRATVAGRGGPPER